MLHINMETFLVANERNGACHFDIDAKLVQNMLTTLGVDAKGSDGILFRTIYSQLEGASKNYVAQSFLSKLFTLNHDIDDSTKQLLVTLFSRVDSSAEGVEQSIRNITSTIGNMAPEGVFKAEVNFGITMDTKKLFFWCVFVASYIAYQKYNDNQTVKLLMLGSAAALLYYYHSDVVDLITKYFSPTAQTSALIEMLVEGTSLLLFGMKSVSTSRNITELMDSFTSMNNNSRNFTQYITRCFEWIGQLVTYLTTTYGIEWKNIFVNEHSEELKMLSDMLLPLEKKMEEGYVLADMDKRDLNLVNIKLQELTMSMARKSSILPKNIGLSCIASRIRVLEAYCSSNASVPQTRQIPYCVMLTGPPGVGKDVILQNIIAPVLVDYVMTDTEREASLRNPAKYKPVSLNPTDKFQQGVTPETLSIVYHDMFAVKTVASADIMAQDEMLLHLLSSEAFVVKSADVDSKGKMFAQPKLVFATTNYAGGAPPPGSTLMNHNAFYRRMAGHVWLAVAHPDYLLPQIGNSSFKMTGNPKVNLGRLDYKKFQDACIHNDSVLAGNIDEPLYMNRFTDEMLKSSDATLFYKYDLEKGQPAEGAIYTLKQMLDSIKADMDKHFSHGTYLVDSLQEIAEEYKAQMMRIDPFKPITTNFSSKPRIDMPVSEFFRLAITGSPKLDEHYEAFYYSRLYSMGVEYASLKTWLLLYKKANNRFVWPLHFRAIALEEEYDFSYWEEKLASLSDAIKAFNYTPSMEKIAEMFLTNDFQSDRFVSDEIKPFSVDITRPDVNVVAALDTNNKIWDLYESKYIRPLISRFVSELPSVSQHFIKRYFSLSSMKRAILEQLSPYDAVVTMYDFVDSTTDFFSSCDYNLYSIVSRRIRGVWNKASEFVSSIDSSCIYSWLVGAGLALTVLPCISLLKTVFKAVFPDESYKAQAFSGSEQDDKSISSVINKNLYWMDIQIVDPEGRVDEAGNMESLLYRGNYILMIGGRVGITTQHTLALPMAAYPECQFNVRLYSMNNMDHAAPDFMVPAGAWFHKHLKDDSCMLMFPTIKEFPDIRNKIVKEADMARYLSEIKQSYAMCTYLAVGETLAEKRVYTSTYRYTGKSEPIRYIAEKPGLAKLGRHEPIQTSNFNSILDKPVFTSVSFDGACGLPYFVKVKGEGITKLYPETNQPMISAIHCAGSIMGGIAISISREMFAGIDLCISGTLEDRMKRAFDIYASVKEKYSNSHDRVDPVVIENPQLNAVGQYVIAKRPKVSVPIQTALVKSKLYGDSNLSKLLEVSEPLYPALLGNVKVNEGDGYKFVPVIEKNILKYGKNVGGHINFEAYSNMATIYNAKLFSLMPNYEEYFYEPPLNDDGSIDVSTMYDRVVKGYHDDLKPGNNFRALARNKSVGPNVKDFFGFLNRKEVFGDGVLPDLDTEESNIIKELVLKFNDELVNGRNILVMVNAVNKDELRPRSRVIEGKTRIFSSSDLPFLLLSIIYLRDVIQVCKRYRIKNGMLVGINPYSKEWNVLAEGLLEKSDYVMATDHSGFDTDRTEIDWLIFCDFIHRFYLKEHNTLRHKCRMQLLQSMGEFITVVPSQGEERFISMYRSLCSGWLITSLYGTYINALAHHICFSALLCTIDNSTKGSDQQFLSINLASHEELQKYSDAAYRAVRSFHYGDDSIISTTEPELFSVKHMSIMMKLLFNCTITDENEDIVVDDYHKSWKELGYVPLDKGVIIARSFNKVIVDDELGQKMVRYVAPLRKVSLNKMAFWDKKGQSDDIILAKYDLLLKEASLHGVEFHSEMAKNLAPRYIEYGVSSAFLEWKFAFNTVLNDEFEHFDGDEFVEMI